MKNVHKYFEEITLTGYRNPPIHRHLGAPDPESGARAGVQNPLKKQDSGFYRNDDAGPLMTFSETC